MKNLKKILVILFSFVIIFMTLTGCSQPGVSITKEIKKESVNNTTKDIKSKILGTYTYGFVSIEALNWGNSQALVDKYNSWKTYTVTSSGCLSGQLRIQRDNSTFNDTVSEGIGYGMLFAVYFNDRATFDGLYKYCKAHFIKVNGSTVPLMHWKVDKNGNNVSEFVDYITETTKITFKANNTTYNYTSAKANVPHDVVYGNLKTGKIWVVPTYTTTAEQNITNAERQYFDNNSDYYKMCLTPRGLSSATDADEDIAAALCFASKLWTGGSINYSQEATNMINAIQNYEFTSDGFIKAGNGWGGMDGWNPCYFTPAYYKYIFAKQCPNSANFWNTAYTRMYQEMTFVKDSILQMNGYNPSAVFFPDWCNTIPVGYGKYLQKSTITDRVCYNNGSINDPMASNGPGGFYLDARWKDNTTRDQYGTYMLSFNNYYDAVRVPWRIANDYIWGSTEAQDLVNVISQSQGTYNSVMARKDGCSITGGAWNFSDRDGYSRNKGGTNSAETFATMAACINICGTPDSNYFTNVSNYKIAMADYGYFRSALTIFADLCMSGKLLNLYDDNYVGKKVALYRYRNPNTGDHYYSTSPNEGAKGYTWEGIACNVYNTSVIDGGKTTALYRLHHNGTDDHFYTTSFPEAYNAMLYCGYTYEGIACNVATTQLNGTSPVYRYNNGRDHFYTANWNELGGGAAGYTYEGIAFYGYK